MTLSTVFRIQALVFALFGVLMLFMPGSMMESFGVESSETMTGVLQNMSIMVLGIAYLSWQMPSWVGDNLKTVGMFFAILHVAFVIIAFYHMSIGLFPFDAANIGGSVPDALLAILLFWKSRADA
ncbi:MAG: hypothetical protein NZ771_08085 [Candidatus Marinimicrobia bacterium]|nr:hypothetical protein [Candidatus Neomarinimicrobiota bacterium]